MLEDLKTRQIRFLRVELPSSDSSKGKSRLKFVQLGVMVNHTHLTISPLIKYRSVCKTNPKSGKKFQVALVLRENGRFEVYSDFILVNEYYDPKKQCVDIDTDFNQFFIKFVKDADKVDVNTEMSELQFEVR